MHQRIDRQKLIFNSIIAGIGLLIFAIFLKKIWITLSPVSADWLKSLIPLNVPYSGTTLLSFFLGVAIAEGSNLLISFKKCIRFAIKEIGNELELLLDECANDEELVLLTLKNDKVYVGWVKTLPIPQHSNYVRIAPAFSGFRHKETKRLEFTTEYLQVYSTYISNGEATDIKLLTSLVIKMDEILTASQFDIDMYERFLAIENTAPSADIA